MNAVGKKRPRGRSTSRRSRSSASSVRQQSGRRFSLSGSIPGYSGSIAYESGDAYAHTDSSGYSGGGSAGKASGFISTPLKPHDRRASTADVRGTSIVLEVGGELNAGASTATAGNTVCIGHATVPVHTAHLVMWRAIVKQVLVRMGLTDMSDFRKNLPAFSVGDTFAVIYSQSADSAWTAANYNVPGIAFSAETIAEYFANFFRTNYSPELVFQQINFQSVTPVPIGNTFWPPVYINLKGCSFTVYSKSALKVQNQSRGNLGGDEDAVDNNPIVGRAYFGHGNGSTAVTQDDKSVVAGRPFIADSLYGAIAVVPTDLVYQEPPPATQFDNVTLYGKCLMEPGHIKTSRLTYQKSLPMDEAYRAMFAGGNLGIHPTGLFGNFRFMLFEKMISSSTGNLNNAIKISYECQLEIGGYVYFRKDTRTAQLNSLANYKNEV